MELKIENIKMHINALYLTESAEDFSIAWSEIQKFGNYLDDFAQEEAANNSEKLSDSFGGDISLRQLKGE